MSNSLAEAQSPNLPPAVFLQHYRTIRDATRAADEARMVVTRAKKAAKSDGVDLAALKLHEALAKLDDDEAEIRVRHLFDYRRFLEMPLGSQASLFPETVAAIPDKAAGEQAEWAAGDAGYLAGKGGKLRSENPYEEGGPLHVAWDRQFLRGLKVLAAELRADEDIKADKAADKKAAKVTLTQGDEDAVVSAGARKSRGRQRENGVSAATH